MSVAPLRSMIRGALAALLVAGAAASAAAAADAAEIVRPPLAGRIDLEVGAVRLTVELDHARTIELPGPAATVFVANPAIADVQAKDPRRVVVYGRKLGGTTIYVTDAQKQVSAYTIQVVRPTAQAAEAVKRAGRGDLRVSPTPKGLSVTGTVESPRDAAAARAAAEQFVETKEGLDFAVGVTGETQVNLQVRIVEVSRSVSRTLGFSWNALSNNGSTILGLATGRNFAGPEGVIPPFTRSSALNPADTFLFGYRSPGGSVNINGVLDALQTEGWVSVLAQPNLTAASGQSASFLAGGEFPVPVAQERDTITIEWKKFGVALDFTPVVLDPGRLSIKVRPEVSEITDRGSVVVNNIRVPGLAVRRAETTVELASGQSFAIAGLFQNNIASSVNKFPWLADIPVVGQLLRSKTFQQDESELVIIVTPYIVRPVSRTSALRTPADGLTFANELESVLMGRVRILPENRPHLSGPAGFLLEDRP